MKRRFLDTLDIDRLYSEKWAFIRYLSPSLINCSSLELPETEFVVLDNGDLEISMDAPHCLRVSLTVPAGEWRWKHEQEGEWSGMQDTLPAFIQGLKTGTFN